jgi:Family of unknown function (DUF6152)
MKFTVLGGALFFLVPLGMLAHHGWAAFDPKATVTYEAKVTEFHFVNPHSVVEFEFKDDHGQIEKWEGELTSNLRLSRKGWFANSLEAGMEITISGYRAQSGAHVIRVTKIVLASGKELELEPGD